MRKAVGFIAVTAAAPLVALAVGAPTAWATPSGHGASVSINGVTHGSPNSSSTATSTPSTSSKPNIAVAVNGSTAAAGFGDPGSGNKAIATNGSHANAGFFSNNTAVAKKGGVVNCACGVTGDPTSGGNTATATGAGSVVNAIGTNNTATTVNGGLADALGTNNTATATNGGTAIAGNGDPDSNNTATASNGGTAIATGTGNTATCSTAGGTASAPPSPSPASC